MLSAELRVKSAEWGVKSAEWGVKSAEWVGAGLSSQSVVCQYPE